MFSLSGYKKFLPLFLITCLVVIGYGKTYQNEFLGMDDHVYVWDNPYIKDGLTVDGVIWAFKADLTDQSEFADYWQPVTFISRMIDISLFQFNAGWHHLVNLLFHIFNVWLLYFILTRLTGSSSVSLWVTLLWAVHPLHTEIIGWTTARKDVLSVFFGLSTIHFYFLLENRRLFLRQATVAILFALSLMAKPMMITIPVLLILFDIYADLNQGQKLSIKKMFKYGLDKWPLFLLICLYLPIPFLGQPEAFDNVNAPLVKAVTAYIFYLQKIFIPIKLSLYGPIPEPKVSFIHFILALSGVIVVMLLAWLARKRNLLILLGWGWFLLTTLPIIALTWQADRFVYFPSVGVLLMFAVFLKEYIKKKDYVYSLILPLVIFFVVQSYRQIQVWKNDESIMLKALTFSSENYSAHNVLGVYYARHGDTDKALDHLKEAVRIRPERDKPYNNIGLILEQKGQIDEALEYFKKSVELKPQDFRTINNIGIVYVRQGKYLEGIEYFNRALKINPLADDIQNNIAIAYFKAGQFQKAEAIASKLNSAYLYNQFGLFCAIDKRFEQALPYFEKALVIDPNFPKTRGYINQIKENLSR